MGDRTHVWIEIRPQDERRLVAITGRAGMVDEEVDRVRLFYDDVNYGGYDWMEEAAKQGILFRMGWGCGSDYCSGQAVCVGEEFVQVVTVDGTPITYVYEHIGVDEDMLEEARAFYRLWDELDRVFRWSAFQPDC